MTKRVAWTLFRIGRPTLQDSFGKVPRLRSNKRISRSHRRRGPQGPGRIRRAIQLRSRRHLPGSVRKAEEIEARGGFLSAQARQATTGPKCVGNRRRIALTAFFGSSGYFVAAGTRSKPARQKVPVPLLCSWTEQRRGTGTCRIAEPRNSRKNPFFLLPGTTLGFSSRAPSPESPCPTGRLQERRSSGSCTGSRSRWRLRASARGRRR